MLIDFTDIEDDYAPTERLAPLPPGVYRVCVNSAEFGQSKSGKDMVTVEFIVSEGHYKARTQKRWFSVEGKPGRGTFKQFLETISSKKLEKFDTEHLPKIVGKELLIRTNIKVTGGFKNCEIRACYKLGDDAKAQADFENDHEPVEHPVENIPF
jgi:hypothetical protein